jgi:hypothetical protein
VKVERLPLSDPDRASERVGSQRHDHAADQQREEGRVEDPVPESREPPPQSVDGPVEDLRPVAPLSKASGHGEGIGPGLDSSPLPRRENGRRRIRNPARREDRAEPPAHAEGQVDDEQRVGTPEDPRVEDVRQPEEAAHLADDAAPLDPLIHQRLLAQERLGDPEIEADHHGEDRQEPDREAARAQDRDQAREGAADTSSHRSDAVHGSSL